MRRRRTPSQKKKNVFRPVPHDRCACLTCDTIRLDNAAARVMFNWPSDYPPMFYGDIQSEAEAEWEAQQVG